MNIGCLLPKQVKDLEAERDRLAARLAAAEAAAAEQQQRAATAEAALEEQVGICFGFGGASGAVATPLFPAWQLCAAGRGMAWMRRAVHSCRILCAPESAPEGRQRTLAALPELACFAALRARRL